MRAALTREPIDILTILAEPSSESSGAVVTFQGIVRDHSRGKRVIRLHYEAYEEMALAELDRLAGAMEARPAVEFVKVVHRLGTLGVGETAVCIVVGAPHRSDAFDACRDLIDGLKETVPIWKKEYYQDGEQWIHEGA
jgi:molybdopterin synthase catalytic subunit